jgi:uncharacterized protein (DUF433 family)
MSIAHGASSKSRVMNENELLQRITVNPRIFGGKPIIRGRRLAVEHSLGMPAAGDSVATILEGYPWLEPIEGHREGCELCGRNLRECWDLR